MKTLLLYLVAVIGYYSLSAQTITRIPVQQALDTEAPGWNLSAYLDDDSLNQVQPLAGAGFQYSTVELTLQQNSVIRYLDLLAGADSFPAAPCFIYTVSGADTTYSGKFTGSTSLGWTRQCMPYALTAGKILLRRYGNGLPLKIRVYGFSYTNGLNIDSLAPRQFYPSVNASIQTGMNFNPWLNDNLNSLVASVWASVNMQYVDVELPLNQRSRINRISLYDEAGVFTSNSCSLLIKKNGQLQYVGLFQGLTYKQFVNYDLGAGLQADAIVVRKYGNNIPQKVQVYGRPVPQDPGTPLIRPVPQHPLPLVLFTAIQVTGNSAQRYEPMLKQSLDSLVLPDFSAANQQWTDLDFSFEATRRITGFQYYALDNTNYSYPAQLYLKVDTGYRLIYTFSGNGYNRLSLVNFSTPVLAASLRLRKWNNDFPQKIFLYGDADTLPLVKIPIDAKRWYASTSLSKGVAQLFNSDTLDAVSTGFPNWSPSYWLTYPLNPGEVLEIRKIRMYDYTGSFVQAPMKLWALTETGTRKLIATFNGSAYMDWVGPYPDRTLSGEAKFMLDSAIQGFRYLQIEVTQHNLPTEIEFYGHYQAGIAYTAPVMNPAPFEQVLGMNAFEWDFVNPQVNSRAIDSVKYAAIQNFRGFRHYLDWKRIENTPGQFTFSPAHNGGWDLDMTYQQCKSDQIEVLVCIKNIPDWMKATYPSNEAFEDNIPMVYGMPRDSVTSYLAKARAAFQFAARYGRNTQIPDSFMHVNTAPRWPNDPANVVKKGLDLVRYMECGNELDKWWKGLRGYMNPYEYAALLSAFYDGHHGTLGADAGVKTADSSMQVVIGGLASADPSYVRGMIEWCRMNRGYKADGSVDLCWDVINYHYYAAAMKDAAPAGRGVAPELSDAANVAASFVQVAQQYGNGTPVWISEFGYDLNPASPLAAPALGKQSAQQVQASWILRAALLHLRSGLNRIFYYELNDFNLSSPVKYASMGLCDSLNHRRPALDYLWQVNQLMGKYHFTQTVSTYPAIDRYTRNDSSMLVYWLPDERTDSVVMKIKAEGNFVDFYSPAEASNTMCHKRIQVTGDSLTITVKGKPTFLRWVNVQAQTRPILPVPVAADQPWRLFPNPTHGAIQVQIPVSVTGVCKMTLTDLSGRQVALYMLSARSGSANRIISLNLPALPAGIYVYQIAGNSVMNTGRIVVDPSR